MHHVHLHYCYELLVGIFSKWMSPFVFPQFDICSPKSSTLSLSWSQYQLSIAFWLNIEVMTQRLSLGESFFGQFCNESNEGTSGESLPLWNGTSSKRGFYKHPASPGAKSFQLVVVGFKKKFDGFTAGCQDQWVIYKNDSLNSSRSSVEVTFAMKGNGY